MEMGHARYNAMDAQRFDPHGRTNMRLASRFKTRTSDSTPMRQGPCVKSEKTNASDVRPDHEGSCPSPTDTCTTRATSSTPDDVYDPVDIVVTRTIIRPDSNPRGGPRMLSRPQMVFRRMFSRSPSSTNTYSPSQSSSSSVSPRSTPPSRFTSLVLRALNCLSPSLAFDSDVDDMKAHRTERPLLLVMVKETREKYEDDRAFKEIVGSVFPAAGVRGDA